MENVSLRSLLNKIQLKSGPVEISHPTTQDGQRILSCWIYREMKT